MVKEGDKAPDATLQSADGPVKLSDIIGRSKATVLYFYPKDDTPGCTTEACSFRDSYTAFTSAGCTVVGVSSDSVDSHKAFAGKHGLPFTLLSDPDSSARKLYGVKSNLFGLIPGRSTFVIDNSGTVVHVFTSQMNSKEHVRVALEAIAKIAPPAAPAAGGAAPSAGTGAAPAATSAPARDETAAPAAAEKATE